MLGVVDDHPSLPTPAYLLAALPGESVHRSDAASLDPAVHRRIAVGSGRLLADLHALDPIDAYGPVEVGRGDPLAGDTPAANLGRLSVPDGDREWPAHVAREVDRLCSELADGRFACVVPEVRERTADELNTLRSDGPFEPVVGRVEHALDNLLFDPDAADVTGLLDWEFVAGTTAAADLASATYFLAGGESTLLPETPDRRPLVREGLVEGYRSAGGEATVEEFDRHGDCYERVVHLRAASLFDGSVDAGDANADVDTPERAAETLRERVVE